ncbi:CaiB/BaiF CoA-transferase family protein [Gemmobacter sp. JM10B15]|uniref:CaiB/BaiF CoA-transferase family protein n=1 Tax=Gemmobacter denitrificans TaxID=3123040 RepID=A0ABU8BT83_9RHOB
MAGVLQGLRVVEFVGIGPAPFAAMMLADHGAEVIRLHAKGARPEIPLMNTPFDVLGRGRRSVAFDLKAPGGVDLALDLIGRADGLIEGFRLGVMERLGLGPDICLARNPRLAYGRMTGWGQDGPMAAMAGHDMNYLGLTGGLHAMGPASGPPTVPMNYVADFGGGGMMLAFGMLAAILGARMGQPGQVIDAAMVDGAALMAAMLWGFRAGGAWGDGRETNLLDGGAYFYTTYVCGDGRFLAVACIEAKFHALMLDRLGLSRTDFTHMDDPARWPVLKARLAGIFASQPRDHWVALFDGTDACITPILDWAEAPAHPHLAARGTLIPVAGVTQPAPAPRFAATPAAEPIPACPAGADGAAVLHDWGITPDQIAAAVASGAI